MGGWFPDQAGNTSEQPQHSTPLDAAVSCGMVGRCGGLIVAGRIRQMAHLFNEAADGEGFVQNIVEITVLQ
jgi:hypothetical protein